MAVAEQYFSADRRTARAPTRIRSPSLNSFRYACLCLDDIGYVRQDRAETESLFPLLAERYKRRSVMITSNLVFSQWNQIFHDDMTATAAIDRVVHHSVILELTVPSYRAEAARARTQGEEG